MHPNLKKIIITLLSLAFGLALFFWLVGLAGLSSIVKTFLKISIWWTLLFLLVSVGIDLILALRWTTIIKYHGYKVPFANILQYRLMGYAVSYITPSAHVGGEPVRAMMLKRHGIPLPKGFSTIFLDKILEISADIFFGAIGMLMVLVSFKVEKAAYGLMLIAFVITVFLIIKFFTKLHRGEKMFISLAGKLGLMKFKAIKRAFKKIDEVEVAMSGFMSGSKEGIVKVLLMSGVLWCLMFAEYWVALKMVGHNGTLVEIFLVGVFIGISYLIPVPAAIGALEGGQLSLFKLLGQTAALGLVFGLVIRARDLLRTFIGITFLLISGVGLFGKEKPKK